MKTLWEVFTEGRRYQQHKHDLGDTFVADEINALTNEEFLRELSDALDEMLGAAK